MPDISTIKGVAAGSINTVNGVAKASCSTISGVTMPASGASLWCIVGADGGVATAAHSDLNDWTGYVSSEMGQSDGQDDYEYIAYGKDGSGSGLWVAVNEDDSREIRYSSDPTNTSGWSDIADTTADMHGVAWGNNVWIAVGESGELWRSTAGTTGWSEIDLSGVTGWANDVTIYDVASDGAGNWMFGQDMEVFLSTNDGQAWSRIVDFADSAFAESGSDLSGFSVRSIVYTDSRWCVLLQKSGQTRVFHAAASDTSSWSAATVGGSAQASGNKPHNGNATRMAAGDGTVIMVATNANDTSRSTDGGQDWTKGSNDLPRTDCRNIATDGNGNWVAVFDNGRVAISSDDGQTWAEQSGVQDGGSNTRIRHPKGSGGVVENLKGVAADVYLPV
jgi:hypothetical protein